MKNYPKEVIDMSGPHLNKNSNEPYAVRNDVSYERPQVRILDDSQWLFIRKSFRMSPRELEIARLVCGGFNNDEIAIKLKIKSATVKTHLRNVYRRIHVQRKLDMLLKFLDQASKFPNGNDESIQAGHLPLA
jgi:DNA-binding CsgD family transcriptional regulator